MQCHRGSGGGRLVRVRVRVGRENIDDLRNNVSILAVMVVLVVLMVLMMLPLLMVLVLLLVVDSRVIA